MGFEHYPEFSGIFDKESRLLGFSLDMDNPCLWDIFLTIYKGYLRVTEYYEKERVCLRYNALESLEFEEGKLIAWFGS